MVLVFALLCAAAIPRAECTTLTAIDVVRLPDASNELACLQDAMVTVASLAIRAGPDEYWKFLCLRSEPESVVAKARRTHPRSRRN